ncbi:isopeptide-forming domain-containing fimbrial protein [Paenibacillus sp. FSL W8-0194]|uniref:DUF7601 domain-containing protein n=1 Tax=Paenibacillus sp. FSL W8-0194 TaxID=2921711 RepID=UPI0030D8B945
MKRKRSVGKTILSIYLTFLLVFQTLTFSTAVYAESAQDGYGKAEASVSADEPSPLPKDVVTPDEPSPLPKDVVTPDEPSPLPEDVVTPNEPPSLPEEEATPGEPSLVPEGEHAVHSEAMAAEPADKTAVLVGANTPFPLEVTQDGKPVRDDGTGVIHGRQPFTLNLSNIKVPVFGDNQSAPSESIIQKNDKVIFDKETYFPMVDLAAAGSKSITVGGQKIATATFSETSLTITFDGDDVFFNGNKRNVVISLTFSAKADLSDLGDGEDRQTEIFGKNYIIDNPPLTPAYKIAINPLDSVKPSQYSYVNLGKNSFVEGTITWKVDVEAFDQIDNTIPLPLTGTTFYDDISKGASHNAAGVYVDGSFAVDGQPAMPVYENGALSYTFPASAGNKATITFKTWIPKNLYYYEYQPVPGNDGGQKMDTIAQLKDETGNELIKASSYRVNIYPDWIQQSGAVSKRGEDTFVTWTIDVNKGYNKQGLKNFTITDALPAGLSFESAAYQLWDTNTNNWSVTTTPITPTGANNDTYSIPGGENSPVRLVIESKVNSGSSFTNKARANWSLENPPSGLQDNDATEGDNPKTVSAFATVTVGAHGLAKSGTLTADDLKIGATTWTVTMTPQYSDSGAVVYDLLVYSRTPNFIDPSKLDSKGKVAPAVLTALANGVRGNIDLIGQQYLEDSFTTGDGLKGEVIPLYQDGVQVADLLKVSGYTDKQATFNFRTLMTDPEQFAGQYSKTGYAAPRYNRAYLFEGDKNANISAQSYVNRHGNMLDKGMLFASKPLKADGTPEKVKPNDVNSYITNDSNEAWTIAGYDRVTKTATFRLAVNHKGLDTVAMAKYGGNRVASDIKLVDTLPEGWEFAPYDESGKFYELYQGYSSNNSDTQYGTQIRAEKVIPPDSDAHVVSFSHSGNVGTFTFGKLESPYVILLKARPTAEALDAYLATGEARFQGYNKAELKIKWGGVEKVTTEERKVIVPLGSLTKSVTKPAPGIQEWTVNYAPSFAMTDGVYLQDTLGTGLKLREDENGKLSLTSPDMAVYRATMTASGALERDGAALDLTGPDPEVTVEMQKSAGNPTKLIFKMKDPNRYYQFVYQTESSGMSPGKVGNKIELLGDDSLPPIEASSESTLDVNDVSGGAGSNGVLYIQKVDPANKELPGVKFTLYEADGKTPAKDQNGKTIEGFTDANGKLMLLIPTPGLYQLKQTYIDENTYLPTTTVYPVRVADVKDSPTFADGELVTATKPLVVPTPASGKLTIGQTVAGKDGEQDKEFAFTVTFDGEGKDGEYPYTKSDGTTGTIKSGGTIQLKHGQTAVIPILPKDLVYTVAEADCTGDGYTTDPANRVHTGTIVWNGDHKAEFVNTRIRVGGLLVGNAVAGNGGDKEKEFAFTLTFEGDGEGDEYSYTKSDKTTGKIKSGDTILLKHGEAITVEGLPPDIAYTVTEANYTADGYTTNPEDRTHTGVIVAREIAEAKFVNTRELPGGTGPGPGNPGNPGPDPVNPTPGDGNSGTDNGTPPSPVIESEKIAMDLNGSSIEIGDTIEYTIRSRNTVPGTTVTNLAIADKLPKELEYVTGSLSVDGKSVTDAIDNDKGAYVDGTVNGQFGNITDTNWHTIVFQAKVVAGQSGLTIRNTAEVTGGNLIRTDRPFEDIAIGGESGSYPGVPGEADPGSPSGNANNPGGEPEDAGPSSGNFSHPGLPGDTDSSSENPNNPDEKETNPAHPAPGPDGSGQSGTPGDPENADASDNEEAGNKLPDTATNMYNYFLAGFIMLLAGWFLLRKKKA